MLDATVDIKKYNWLILGGGAVVREYYLPAFQYLGLMDRLTIVEPSAQSASFITNNFSCKVYTSGYQEYFRDHKISDNTLCIITLPNFLHYDAIKLCAGASVPVLCEKPLTVDVKQAKEIEELHLNNKAFVVLAMVRRFMPSFNALKKTVQSNFKNEINNIEIEDGSAYAWLADSPSFFEKRNGGVLADMGVHYLDLVYDLLGELDFVSYESDAEGGVEANCLLQLKSKKGVPVSIKLSRTHKLKNKFSVHSDNGTAEILKDDFEFCYTENAGVISKHRAENVFRDVDLSYIFESCFVEQLQQFALAVEAKNKNHIDPSQAVNNISIIERAYSTQLSLPKNHDESYVITGGSGFIGSALIEHLARKGTDITAPLRSYKHCADIARFEISMPRLDLFNEDQLAALMKDKKYVVHLAYASDGKDAYKINVEGTKKVVKAAFEAGVESIVVLSSMYVHGHHSADQELDETIGFHPYGGEYAKTKMLMQKWCMDFASKNNSTRLVILNPSCVYGPKGKTYTTMPYQLAHANRFVWIEEGKGIANYVYIDHLIDAIELALQNKNAHGKAYLINDGYTSWKNFLQPFLLEHKDQMISYSESEIAKQSFKKPSTLKQILAYLVSDYNFLELINRHPVLGKLKSYLFEWIPSTRKNLDEHRMSSASGRLAKKEVIRNVQPPVWLTELFGYTKTKYSSAKARKELGWKSKLSFEEAQSITVGWLEDYFKNKC